MVPTRGRVQCAGQGRLRNEAPDRFGPRDEPWCTGRDLSWVVVALMPDGSFDRLFADELHVKRVRVTADHPFVIELPWGAVLFSANEVTIVSVVDDPPGLRFCAAKGGLGKLSWNLGVGLAQALGAALTSLAGALVPRPMVTAQDLNTDLRQTEVVLLQGKQAEWAPGRAGGEVTLHMADPYYNGPDPDKAMKRGLLLDSRASEITNSTGGGMGDGPAMATVGRVKRFYSDDERYLYIVQGDATPDCPYGRIVQYRIDAPDESIITPVAILRPEAVR